MGDILTVMWKERRTLLRYQGSRLRLFLALASPLVLAIYIPLSGGPGWATGYSSLLLAFFVPVILAGISIPDAIAGERERHTLETLLASRLPDHAILIGKLATTVVFAWATTVLVLLVSLVTANLVHGGERLLLYRPAVAIADLLVSLGMALLVCGLGIHISLRAPSVQEAAQILMSIFMLPPMLLGLLFFVLGDRVRAVFIFIGGARIGPLALLILYASAALLLLTGAARFRRARLFLD